MCRVGRLPPLYAALPEATPCTRSSAARPSLPWAGQSRRPHYCAASTGSSGPSSPNPAGPRRGDQRSTTGLLLVGLCGPTLCLHNGARVFSMDRMDCKRCHTCLALAGSGSHNAHNLPAPSQPPFRAWRSCLWRWRRIRQGTASRPRPTTASPLPRHT